MPTKKSQQVKPENKKAELKEPVKILVTGGAGYVGSALVPQLLEAGYFVRILDNLSMGGSGIVNLFNKKNIEFIKGDIRDAKLVKRAAEGVDYIIHLAAIVGYPACRKDPKGSREINVTGTQNVVKAAGKKIPILYASTGSNYGKLINKFCTETTPLNPLSDYGKQKTKAEEIVKKNNNFVIFRFATAFGLAPRLRLDLLINDFCYRAVKEKTLVVYEREFMRTFIHVRDMGRAFLHALENFEQMNGEIYNVGDNNLNHSKEEVCRMILKKRDYYLHFADAGKDLDQRDYMVSYEKIMKTGFRCTISMEEGIDEMLKAAEVIEVKNPYTNV
jgi:nucleoside-diphosphate-sugar epimerase